MELEDLARAHEALGHPLRLKMYFTLVTSKDALNSSMIAAIVGCTRPLASHHLKILKESGVILEQPAGSYKLYKPSSRKVLDLIDFHSRYLQGEFRAQIG